MPSPWPLGSFLPQPAWRAAVSTTRRRRPVSTGYRSGDSPWFQVSPRVSGLTWRAGPITSRRKSFGSRPAAAASSATNDWIAKACGMFETDRYQPMRVCASASGFSMRRFGIRNGTLTRPMPSSGGCSCFGSGPLRDALARGLGRLRGRPYLAAVADDAHRGGGRLHRRLRHVRDVVLRLQAPRRLRHSGLDIATLVNELGRAARGLFQRGLVSRRIVSCVRTVVPGDLQGLASLDRRPGVARDDG